MGLFIWEAGRDVCRDGDVKRDLSVHIYLYISYLSRFIYMEIILSDVFRPVRATRDQVRSSSKQFLYLNFFNTFIKYIDYYEQWREHFGHYRRNESFLKFGTTYVNDVYYQSKQSCEFISHLVHN